MTIQTENQSFPWSYVILSEKTYFSLISSANKKKIHQKNLLFNKKTYQVDFSLFPSQDISNKLFTQQHLLAHGQWWKHQKNVWYLFKVNNTDTRTTSHVFLLSLLLTLNRFHTFCSCFYYWLWKSKCRFATRLNQSPISLTMLHRVTL